MLEKSGGWRPLGIKEAECRVGCGLYATQRRADWNEYYTEDLKADREARADAIRAADERVQQLEGAVAAVSTRNATAAGRARAALDDARATAARAREPVNYPIQLCYAPSGAEAGVHALEGFHQLAPGSDTACADTRNMYNECQRDKTFDSFRPHDPVSIPIYRMCYGCAADIFVERTASGSTVVLTMDDVLGRADRLGVDDSDIIDPDDPLRTLERALTDDSDVLPPIFAAMTRDDTAASHAASHALVMLYLCSTRGFHQGCALATHGACCPYHAALHSIKGDYPTTRVICFGDDTYGNDVGTVLYRWLAAKAAVCRPLGHVARKDKEQCYSPTSGCPHAPASLPGSPHHPDGLVRGFKGLGAYLGDPEWCRSELARKLLKRLSHLDGIDAIRDFDDFDTARQTQHLLVDASVTSVPVYSLRVQAPHVTLGLLDDATAREVGAPTAADAVDVRVGRTLDVLTCAHDTPPDLRAIAHRQMRLPKSEGGLGKTSAADLAPTAYCASRLATAARLRRWIPLFAAHDPATDPHPYFAVFRDHYADLRVRRNALAASYAALAEDVHHLCDGVTSSSAFHPPRLPQARSLPPISSV